MLLDSGAVIDQADTLYRRTPLHYAAQNAQPWSYDVLVSKGADEHVQDIRGNTPLECTRGIMMQGSLITGPKTMLGPTSEVPSWDEIHNVSIA